MLKRSNNYWAPSKHLCKNHPLTLLHMHMFNSLHCIASHNKSEDCNACHSFGKSVSYSNFTNNLCFSHSFQSFQSNKWHPSIICMTNYKTMCEIVIVLWVVPFGSKMHFASRCTTRRYKMEIPMNSWIEPNAISLSLCSLAIIQKRTGVLGAAVSVWLSL